jgi:iron complex transport system ATP-binding protein
MTAAPRLAIRNLGLRAGERRLVRNLSLEIRTGENWAVLGANGSSKTTLLHALAGLRPAEAGQVLLDGVEIQHVPRRERAQRLGVLFQDTQPPLTSTVLETVLTGRHPYLGRWQNEGPDDHAMAQAALAATGLSALAARATDSLSGGERRRMELATMLTQDAPICLLDEPVNHLDPRYQIELLDLVSRRTQHDGHLNVMVLHDINLALRFCDHGLLLFADGETVHGPLDAIIDSTLLARVYGCAIREVRAGEIRLFVPA